jgi:phenylalanyl-tRNA synthetase beta chain
LRDPSVYPPVEFDLAFVVDEGVPAAALVTITARAEGDLLETVRVFDQYQGKGLPNGKKSLALRYVFRAPDRTLTTDEVSAIRAKLIAAAAEIGATLRGA